MSAEEYLLNVNSLFKDKDGILRVNGSRDTGIKSTEILLSNIDKFLKLKCQELLEIVADKAKILDEDNDVYEQPHVFYCNGEEYKTWVDKNSILNAVDLDNFISK